MCKTASELIQDAIDEINFLIDSATLDPGDVHEVHPPLNHVIDILNRAKLKVVESREFPRVER